jgi:hypothetical protein
MTTSARVRMPSLVNTMSTHQQKEWMWLKEVHVICFRPMWKPTSRTMVTKVSRITSWVLMHSMPWTQRKRWTPIGLMGCVHTRWKMPTIEGWGSPSHIQNDVKKNGEDNRKVGKISQIVSQTLTPRPKHDKIWARWALDISPKNMLERVWWCRHSKMESWNWIICCSMSCSNGGRHAQAGGGRRSHVALKCCWKGNVLLSTHAKASRRKDDDQP